VTVPPSQPLSIKTSQPLAQDTTPTAELNTTTASRLGQAETNALVSKEHAAPHPDRETDNLMTTPDQINSLPLARKRQAASIA
jgi:hypothetical protein